MNREEHIAALEKYRDGILSGGISVSYDDLMIALDASIAALRGPQPDPDTGLVPCGCGGSAAYHISYDGKAWSTTVKVACNKCLINVAFSALYELRGEEALADDAKNAWNTAMGWKGGAEELGGRK